MAYLTDRAGVVRYVDAQLSDLPKDLALTMTITPEKSEGFSVSTVIVELSEDYGSDAENLLAKFFSDTQVNT